MGPGLGTPHWSGPAGVGKAALRPAQFLPHTPPPTLTHSPSAPDTGKSTCCLPWEVPAPGHGLPSCLHYLFPQCFLSHFLVLAVIPC